jgi:uncharacterized membrane protein
LLRLAYRPLCHQQASRSLMLADQPHAVCARCEGLYLGGFIGLLWAAAKRRIPEIRRSWIILAAAPTMVDIALNLVGLPAAPNLLRFVIALPTGCVAGALLAVGFADLVSHGWQGKSTSVLNTV